MTIIKSHVNDRSEVVEVFMKIIYDIRKDLPCKDLHDLFVAVGWSDGKISSTMLESFNISFINSTIVVSAWVGDKLVGCVRGLSDRMFRSILYDLAVMPEF